MNKLEKYIYVTAITAGVFFLIWYFSNIVLYIVFSFVLSLLGKPLMDMICKLKVKAKHIPRWLASTVVLFIFIGVFIVVIDLLVPIAYNKFTSYSNIHLADIKTIIEEPLNKINDFIANYSNSDLRLQSTDIISDITSRFSQIISNTIKNLGSLIDFFSNFIIASFSIFFITFFFLKENMLFKNGLTMLFPLQYEKKISESLDSSINLLSKYFIALLMESSIKLVIITGGFVLFGIDFSTALIIGIISAVLNVIPYIGPLIGAVIGIVIAVAAYQGDVAQLLIFSSLLFSIFQIIDNIIIQPYIYSTSVKAHPLEIFLVILVAGGFAGVWGMLLAIPVYTILRVFAKAFFNNLRVVQRLTKSIDN